MGTQTQTKSKQTTPIRENEFSRISKSMPKDVNRAKMTVKEETQAEILGLVRTNKETGAVEKTNDMDYEDYMNIIHRVRKSKEHTKVRTEQIRLASMYAKELKRQEEIKQEEERLKRETEKIEEDRKRAELLTTMPSLGSIPSITSLTSTMSTSSMTAQQPLT